MTLPTVTNPPSRRSRPLDGQDPPDGHGPGAARGAASDAGSESERRRLARRAQRAPAAPGAGPCRRVCGRPPLAGREGSRARARGRNRADGSAGGFRTGPSGARLRGERAAGRVRLQRRPVRAAGACFRFSQRCAGRREASCGPAAPACAPPRRPAALEATGRRTCALRMEQGSASGRRLFAPGTQTKLNQRSANGADTRSRPRLSPQRASGPRGRCGGPARPPPTG